MQIQKILKQYWGYDTFREMQEDIILSVLNGTDTLAILPTGGGKSICFQVPALAKDGLCLVISPLIALMKDQVEILKQKKIHALLIYSGMNFLEVKKTLNNAVNGNFKFLYVSPERLESSLFLEYLPALPVNLIAVDEAHCISQWGYDFRPPYLRIANLRKELTDVPVLALTASATKEVQDDICDKLAFKNDSKRFQKSFERPNLSYSVFNIAAKQNKLIEICKKVPGTGIIYCKSRKRTKEIAELLTINGIEADFYHAGLSNDLRNAKQESWKKNEKRIVVCTNAFGMGIDKSDVRFVIHYDVPDALESYYQEAGRAGRDEKKAYAVLLYQEEELKELERQADIRFPSAEVIKKVYKALVNYLQIPSGSGEGIYFDFDINDFVRKFELNIHTANYSLKAIEQENLISYNEQIFLPATVVFSVNKEDLFQFEKSHLELEAIIKGLLRSYQGIIDYPSSISEKQLAGFIKKDVEAVKSDLKILQQFGIIDYQPQKDKPQILFLQNRIHTSDFTINQLNHQRRKKAYEKRLHAMIGYVRQSITCRSKMIGNYFYDLTIKNCGICDNCLNQKNIVITAEEFENITNAVFKALPASLNDLLIALQTFKRNKIWKVINYLQAENRVSIDKEKMIVRGQNSDIKKGPR